MNSDKNKLLRAWWFTSAHESQIDSHIVEKHKKKYLNSPLSKKDNRGLAFYQGFVVGTAWGIEKTKRSLTEIRGIKEKDKKTIFNSMGWDYYDCRELLKIGWCKKKECLSCRNRKKESK